MHFWNPGAGRLPPLLFASLLSLIPGAAGCAAVVSRFVESPVPDGLVTHQGEGFVVHTDLTADEVAVVATYLQEARAECDSLFHMELGDDLEVYIFRHGEEASGRWRYAVSLPTGAIHIGYHYALRRAGPPLRLEDLQNGILGDTLRHEISHQHLYRILGRLPRQPWIYEGLPMLIESINLDRADGTMRVRPSRAVYLEVSRMAEDGLSLLPEHVLDMGWQDFYKYAEYGTYGVAATIVDMLHEEAGRPADLAAFCRDLVRRRNAGTIPDAGFRERWLRHVRDGAEIQIQHLKRDIREGNPFERLAALEVLSYTSEDERWSEGETILRRALVENMSSGDPAVKARTFSLALDCITGEIEDPPDPAEDLRLPLALHLRQAQKKASPDLVLHWLDRLSPESVRFWTPETAATLDWTLDAPDPRLRVAGLGAIARQGGPAFLGRLAEMLPDAAPDFTRLALSAIAGIGRSRAVPVLEPCLDSQMDRLRDGAALALAELRHPRARERVLALASQAGHPLQGAALRALSRYPDPEAVAFLEDRALGGESPPGIAPVLRALLWMKSPESFAALKRLFRVSSLRDWVIAAMLEGLDRAECREFLGHHLELMPHPSLALVWSLTDEQLRPHVDHLVRHARARLVDLDVLETFMVRKRLARLGVTLDDREELFARLAAVAEIGWPHEQQILAQLAAEHDPERTLDLLIGQLGGTLDTRRGAIRCLHRLTGLAHDFHWAAPRPYREAAREAWRAWRRETAGRLTWDDANGTIQVK